MKALMYLSRLLSWPFILIGGILIGLGSVISWLGSWIHDQTEYRAWLVLHKRWCAAQSFCNEEPETSLSNAVLAGHAFCVLEDGKLIIPYGEAPHQQGPQSFQREDADRVVAHFNSPIQRAKRWAESKGVKCGAGVPIYIGHPDMPGMANVYPDSKAYGWVESMQAEADRLVITPKWSEPGTALVNEAHYRFHSPHWDAVKDKQGKWRPKWIVSLGLTNRPNFNVPAIANESQSDIEPMKLNPQTLALLGLATDAEHDVTALENAITSLHGRASTAETGLANANTIIQTEQTARGTAESQVTALANEVTAAREALVNTGIASLQSTGHLVPADVAVERPRILAMANVSDITNELKRLGTGAPKLKTKSVTDDAPAANAARALANDTELRRGEFNRLVQTERKSLEDSGTPPMTAYQLAHNKVFKTHGHLLQAVA